MNASDLEELRDKLYDLSIEAKQDTETGDSYYTLPVADLVSFITTSNQKAATGAREELAREFQTVAIPEKNDYANGWNDCRKRVRADLNRLAGIERTSPIDKEEK